MFVPGTTVRVLRSDIVAKLKWTLGETGAARPLKRRAQNPGGMRVRASLSLVERP